MAATIFYEFSGGTGNYQAELVSGGTEIVVSAQTHTVAGSYSFSGISDGIYDIRIIDAESCFTQYTDIVVNCDGTTTTSTTTSTTTTSTTSTTTEPPEKPKIFFAYLLNDFPSLDTNNGTAGTTVFASGETVTLRWTTDSGDTQGGTSGDNLATNIGFTITLSAETSNVEYFMGNNSANISGLDSAGTNLTFGVSGSQSYSMDSGASNGYMEIELTNSGVTQGWSVTIEINPSETYELGVVADSSDVEYELKTVESGGPYTNGYVSFDPNETIITGEID
jgi:hypothetical protein